MRITIIGSGSMAIAIAYGLKDRYELEFVARDISKLKEIREEFNADVSQLKEFDITGRNLILAVKPYALESLREKLIGKAKTVYSVLAGSSIDKLKSNIDAEHFIRVMPNISARFGASTSIITGDEVKMEEAKAIFSTIGDTFWVDSEKEIDIATAVAGSGPALLALVAEALMDGLVKQGLKRNDAIGITNSLFSGFTPLIASNHPAIIKDLVMSPSGTTASAYFTLEENSVRASFMKAIEEAFKVTQRKS